MSSFRDALHGLAVTPVTPFTSDLRRVDLGALRSNIEFLVESGVELLYPCGHVGEFSSLSLEEWTSVVETVLDTAGDRAAVAPGVGHGFAIARDMLQRAKTMGAEGALVMPPPPAFLSDTGLKNYYVGLANDVDLPAVLYKRGGWPGDEALIDIVQSTSAAGVKYGDTDVNAFAATVEKAGSEAAWTCGVAERWAPFFHLAGSAGFTSGLANFAPFLALDMITALNTTDYSKAMQLRGICLPFEDIRNREGGANIVAAVKVAMDAHGLAGGRVRPPLRDLDEAAAAEVEEITAGWFPAGA